MKIINNNIFDIGNTECYKYVQKFKNAKRFLASFRQDFNTIIAYHGTRIDEQEFLSIKNNGLTSASVAGLKKMAVSRFILPSDSSINEKTILEIIDDFFVLNRLITLGEVNLVIDRELLNKNYHYLLFGPESLLPLADRINREHYISARKRMMEFGTSSIVKSYVPCLITKDIWISGIYEYINNNFIDVSLVIKESLPAKNIIDIQIMENPCDWQGFQYI